MSRPILASAPSFDPADRAADFHVEVLLSCALREQDAARIVTADEVPVAVAGDAAEVALLPVLDGHAQVAVGLAYRSETGRHRYRLPPRLWLADGGHTAIDLPTLAALLVASLGGRRADASTRLAVVERVAQSTEAVAGFLRVRAGELTSAPFPASGSDFLTAEQSLTLGHPFHPTPKSRGEMRPDERDRYAPETRGRFALRWLAVDRELVQHDSAVLAADGTHERSAPELTAALLGDDRPASAADLGDRVLLPVHPWELDRLRGRDDIAGLLCSGALLDLGPAGAEVTPTTSVRTVYQERWPFQLKFSLHVRVTNSMRVTLPKELDRAIEAARLSRTEVGRRMAEVAPHWVVVQDPAYLAVRHGDGLIDALSVLLRDNRWADGCGLDAATVTALCQVHPVDGRSRLARIVDELAATGAGSPAEVARRWFARYCEVLIVSILRIYLEIGLTFEPHQQNVVLELEGGWPVRAVHRDSQGYFHREAAHADLTAIVPGLGEATESIFPEALADERLVYYPFVNNALGVIGALGSAGLIDERILLADLRAVIQRERERGGRYPATLLDRLLDDDRWPCKANLRTRVDDLDELVGDIADQSVYVTMLNPLGAQAAVVGASGGHA